MTGRQLAMFSHWQCLEIKEKQLTKWMVRFKFAQPHSIPNLGQQNILECFLSSIPLSDTWKGRPLLISVSVSQLPTTGGTIVICRSTFAALIHFVVLTSYYSQMNNSNYFYEKLDRNGGQRRSDGLHSSSSSAGLRWVWRPLSPKIRLKLTLFWRSTNSIRESSRTGKTGFCTKRGQKTR